MTSLQREKIIAKFSQLDEYLHKKLDTFTLFKKEILHAIR